MLWIRALVVLLLGAVALAAAELPQMAVADLASSSFEKTKISLLTDAFRSELFKSDLFRIQDKPWVVGSPAPGVEKGTSGTVDRFGDSLVLNIKITDLASGNLDFSETITLTDEAQLFRALKEMVSLITERYRKGAMADRALTPEERANELSAVWKSHGAEGAVLTALVATGETPENFLSFRQYDGTITAAEYLDLLKQNIDLENLRAFLQAGISYRDSRRALSMGITRLDKYTSEFQPAHIEFKDYLEAYSLGISSATEYRRYLTESERDFLSVGVGGVANTLPLGSTEFKFVIGQLAWEHSWTANRKDWYHINSEAGVILLGLFLPTPYAGVNLMLGSQPFFFKIGIGGHTEPLVGGHSGVQLRLGIEVASRFEFSFLMVPFGTQSTVDYTNSFNPVPLGSKPIYFPYYGLLFTYKFPLSGGLF